MLGVTILYLMILRLKRTREERFRDNSTLKLLSKIVEIKSWRGHEAESMMIIL